MKWDLEKRREEIKQGLLSCLKDIEQDIEPIMDRLMARCMGGSIEIIINPMEVIRYVEKHEHCPREPHCCTLKEQPNGEESK